MQMQGQALDDVTALVDLAALDGGGHTEGVADRFAERLRAIDDEQPGQRRIEPPGEEIVEQGLDDDSVLRRPLDHGQDMLVAVAIDADRRHQDMVADMQTVDLDDQQVELREVQASQAFIFLRDSATKRRETADFEVPSPRAFARSPSGRRTARWYLRVDTFRTIRLSAHSSNRLPSRSTCQLSKPTSLPAWSRTRGRCTFTRPPW